MGCGEAMDVEVSALPHAVNNKEKKTLKTAKWEKFIGLSPPEENLVEYWNDARAGYV